MGKRMILPKKMSHHKLYAPCFIPVAKRKYTSKMRENLRPQKIKNGLCNTCSEGHNHNRHFNSIQKRCSLLDS